MLLAIAVLLAALFGWQHRGNMRRAGSASASAAADGADLSPESLDERLLAVESEQQSARRAQSAQEQRLVDTRARTGLLRDEVLALTQRASLLEDSVREAAQGGRSGVAALRLDEAELLLTIAQQRLQLGGDLDGAIRATELANGVLSTQRDPALLDLRQTLEQELAALKALPPAPRASAAGELDALEAMLPRLGGRDSLGAGRAAGDAQAGWRGLLDSLVQVRRSGNQDLLSPSDREAGAAALALELALARSALAGGDEVAFRRALAHIDAWLVRLYPDGPLLRDRRARLAKLRTLELNYDLPIAGAALKQLQALRHEHAPGA